MQSFGKSRSVSLSLLLLVFFMVPSLHSGGDLFPVGLYLEYQLARDIHGTWDEEYSIIRWVPELGETILLIQYSSTKDVVRNKTLFVDITSWSILLENGSSTVSQIQPPLWVESTDWDEGDFIQIPTYPNYYYIAIDRVCISAGLYPCWRAYTVPRDSMDDDYQIYEEDWYFDLIQGVLMKHTAFLPASQFIPYSYSYRKELVTSNLNEYGVLSEEERTEIMFRNLTWIFLVLCVNIIGFTLLYYRRYPKKNQ